MCDAFSEGRRTLVHEDTGADWNQDRDEDHDGDSQDVGFHLDTANLPDRRHREWHEDDRQQTDGDLQTNHVRPSAS